MVLVSFSMRKFEFRREIKIAVVKSTSTILDFDGNLFRYTSKITQAILGLNIHNFAADRNILMKLHFQRALYNGMK